MVLVELNMNFNFSFFFSEFHMLIICKHLFPVLISSTYVDVSFLPIFSIYLTFVASKKGVFELY